MLGLSERAREVVLCVYRQDPVGPFQRGLHRRHEVVAGRPFPNIQLDGVPGVYELLSDPFCPLLISTGVRYEEVSPPMLARCRHENIFSPTIPAYASA
jgi:hypothetical protein